MHDSLYVNFLSLKFLADLQMIICIDSHVIVGKLTHDIPGKMRLV